MEIHFQVDEAEFLETQNKASLQSSYDVIRNVLHINWSAVSWTDLIKPLYSGIAAALYTLLKSNGQLSWNAEEQGNFWAQNFHGGASAFNFTTQASVLDEGNKTTRT